MGRRIIRMSTDNTRPAPREIQTENFSPFSAFKRMSAACLYLTLLACCGLLYSRLSSYHP